MTKSVHDWEGIGMQEYIGKKVRMREGPKKRGMIEYADEQYIVVYFTIPRKERVVFANNDSFFQKVELLEN
jgi:hypothetical protein